MRGGYIHNEILVGTLARDARALGWGTLLEAPVPVHDSVWFIDLVVTSHAVRVAVEAELSPGRVLRDVIKAEAFGAVALLVVTPTSRVAKQCRRVLGRPDLPTWVLPLGRARARLRHLLSQISRSNEEGNQWSFAGTV